MKTKGEVLDEGRHRDLGGSIRSYRRGLDLDAA